MNRRIEGTLLPHPAMQLVHIPTFRLNSVLFGLLVTLSVVLWTLMPERYPVRFDLSGNPTAWEDRGIGMWILINALFIISFGKAHLFQRYLMSDPASELLNVPYKKHFRKLPTERKVRVLIRANRFLGLMNTGVLLIFICVLFMIFLGATRPDSLATVVTRHALNVTIVAVLVAPIFEVVAIRRMVRRKLEEEGIL